MSRLASIGVVLALGCEPQSRTTAPPDSTPPPATTAPAIAKAEPAVDPAANEPTPKAEPRIVQTELGWSRPEDPEGPTIALVGAEYSPGNGAAGASALLDAIEPLLVCWEGAPRTARVSVTVRTHSNGDPALIEVQAFGAQQDPFRDCVERVAYQVVPRPDKGEYMIVQLWFAPHAADITLRSANPDEVVAVRDAGTCWQWEDYPCAPHKHCRADEWVRTTCGEPTMRDDVRLHVGTPAVEAWTDATDLRLLGPDGQVLWLNELPAEAKASLAGTMMGEGTPSIEARRGAGVHDVFYGASEIAVAFPAGMYILDRKTGATKLSWQSPPKGEPSLWFDTGRYVIDTGDQRCVGDAGRGAFVVRCANRWIWLDGHTLAVFDAATHKLLGSKHLGQRGATLEHGKALTLQAKFRVAGLRLEVSGQIFVE